MKHIKTIKTSRPKTIFRWNNGLFVLGFFLTILTLIVGCEKSNTDEYYVKYEVDSSTIYSGGKLDVTINTEKSDAITITINQRVLWEIIIGPVNKGFKAEMQVEASDIRDLKLYTNIYVSKNNSPFALKAIDGSDTPRDFVSIDYTIDY